MHRVFTIKILLLVGMGGLITANEAAWSRLTPLAQSPDWAVLEKYQETITREDFVHLLESVYAPGGASTATIQVGDQQAVIATRKGKPPFVLRFATDANSRNPVSTTWKSRDALPPPPAGKPLHGLKIALDPGHIGGSWARLEERWFRLGKSKPVTEGDMTLLVARKLAKKLEALGAKVFLTRTKAAPVTSARPERLKEAARASLQDRGQRATSHALASESARLFYRVSEIHRRARLVNESLRPDLTLCLHFNAEEWGNESHPKLVDENHLHFLVTGAWSADELTYEDQRFDMLHKLLSRTIGEEMRVTEAVARTMAKATELPPYTYKQNNAVKVGSNPYIWGRNLLANRLFLCPVVYIEPYVMNSREGFARIQAGDYKGTKKIGGVPRRSIFEEYADSVASGLADYYGRRSRSE